LLRNLLHYRTIINRVIVLLIFDSFSFFQIIAIIWGFLSYAMAPCRSWCYLSNLLKHITKQINSCGAWLHKATTA